MYFASPTAAPPFGVRQPEYKAPPSHDWKIRATRALIDAMEFDVAFGRVTTFDWVRRRLGCALGLPDTKYPFVKALEPGPSGASSRFRVRLQDVEPAILATAVAALSEMGRTAEPLHIRYIEIAVDFYPKESPVISDLYTLSRRAAMRLDVGNERPRQYGPATGLKLKRMTTLDHIYEDTTVYWYPAESDLEMKSYPKFTDDKIILPTNQWRARIELTARGSTLSGWGLNTIDDLARFDFRAHVAPHFRFRRQHDGEGEAASLMSAINRYRGVSEHRGMHAFAGVNVTRGRRVNKYSALTRADSNQTNKAARALDRMSKRFAENLTVVTFTAAAAPPTLS